MFNSFVGKSYIYAIFRKIFAPALSLGCLIRIGVIFFLRNNFLPQIKLKKKNRRSRQKVEGKEEEKKEVKTERGEKEREEEMKKAVWDPLL